MWLKVQKSGRNENRRGGTERERSLSTLGLTVTRVFTVSFTCYLGTYKATAVKVHQDLGSTLTSVPLTSVQWYEVEDLPCGVPCWEKGTAVSVWTVAHLCLRSLPGLILQLWCLVPCNPLAALTQEYPTCISVCLAGNSPTIMN